MISDDKIYDGVRNNIQRLREKHPKTEKKITQQALAKAIGIKRATLTNIELGNQRAPVHVIYRVCDYFGVPLEDVMPAISDVEEEAKPKKSIVDVGEERHSLPEQLSAAVKKARSL